MISTGIPLVDTKTSTTPCAKAVNEIENKQRHL